MNVRFISSLTPEDENIFARAMLKACSAFLDMLPIAYTIHIETTDNHVYQHSRAGQHPIPAATRLTFAEHPNEIERPR